MTGASQLLESKPIFDYFLGGDCEVLGLKYSVDLTSKETTFGLGGM